MSECSDIAFLYSARFNKSDQFNSRANQYIFINEVMESEKLEEFKFDSYNKLIRINLPLTEQFCKHMFINSPSIAKKRYRRDSKGRRYRNVAVDKRSVVDAFVADKEFVKPRYIIHLVTDVNVDVHDRLVDFIKSEFWFEIAKYSKRYKARNFFNEN